MYHRLHFDAKLSIASTSIAAWNALMRADPIFGRFALTSAGRLAFLATFTVVIDNNYRVAGKLHRVGIPGIPGSGGPAATYPNGHKEWYERDKLHRIDGPARIYACGREDWYERGQLHRADTPGSGAPAIIDSSGHRLWYERGLPHRVGGPAATYADGAEEWWEHGELHRVGGPAIICADGTEAWYERGIVITKPLA